MGAGLDVPLLLASNSPRRRELLTQAGFRFKVVAPALAEKFTRDFTLAELTEFNALLKAKAVSHNHPETVVLAADTLVEIENEIIGKPKDHDEAVAILRRLSGRVHNVCSSVVVCRTTGRNSLTRTIVFHEFSRVHFRRLDDAAIRAYLERVDPLDKAGGYAAQNQASEIIKKIDGSYTNVVGLPMEKTTRALREFSVEPALA